MAGTYLCLQQGQETTSNQGLAVKRRSQVVRVIATGGHIGDPEQSAKGVIVQTVGGKEVLVLLVTGTSPEVTNLLGLDVTGSERRAVQSSSGDLQDGKRGDNVAQGLSHTGNVRNQRRQRDRKGLPEGDQGDQVDKRSRLHLDGQ
jgi:hypothetical protein